MTIKARSLVFPICILALACGDSGSKAESAPLDSGSVTDSPKGDAGTMEGSDGSIVMGTDAGVMVSMDSGSPVATKDAGVTKDAGTVKTDAGPQLPPGDWIDVGQGPQTIDASKTKCGLKLDTQVLFRAATATLTVGVAFDGTPMVADYSLVDFYESPYGTGEAGAVGRISGTDYDSVGGGTVKYLGGNPIRLQVLNAVMESAGGLSRNVSAQFTCPAGTTLRPTLPSEDSTREREGSQGTRQTARQLLVD